MNSNLSIPDPKMQYQIIPKEKLLRQYQILQNLLVAGTLLIDVRKNEYKGGLMKDSLNMPAETFEHNMSTLWRLCQGDGLSVISRVIIYDVSTNGKAPECAARFADLVERECKNSLIPTNPHVFILEDGIEGWVAGGEQYTQFMDAYEPNYWRIMEYQKSNSGNGSGRKRIAEVPAAYNGPIGVMLDERMDTAKKQNHDVSTQEVMME